MSVLQEKVDAEMQALGLQTRSIRETIGEISEMVSRFLSLPYPEATHLVAFWILGTYLFDRFSYFGYLAIRSATPRCGKSRLLRILSMLSKGAPPITTTPTAAGLFRSTRNVLLLDEVDRLRNADKEAFGNVLAILNVGFEAGGVIERAERSKEGFVVKQYPIFGPKALAGIEALADSLSDRSFQIQMKRTTARMPRLNVRKLNQTFERLRVETAAFADKNGQAIQEAYWNLPDETSSLTGFDDRFQDIAEPLVVLAAFMDSEIGEGAALFLPRLIQGLKTASGRREPLGRERELIGFMEVVKERLGDAEEIFIPTDSLLSECAKRDDLSRIETGRALAGFLKNFDLTPISKSGRVRGYNLTREWIMEWGGRYQDGS